MKMTILLLATLAASPAAARPLPQSVADACRDMKASSDLSDGAMAVAKSYCGKNPGSDECGVAAQAAEFAARTALRETGKCGAALDRAKASGKSWSYDQPPPWKPE
jgi:hypothetical protein